MARVLGHRQTKGAATDNPDLLPPRHISTLPFTTGPKTGLRASTEQSRGACDDPTMPRIAAVSGRVYLVLGAAEVRATSRYIT
jgi:hypothetical protein